jgi:hypothetical protein
MQFLKKNYEKILLGLVLLGLVVAVAFLPFLIGNEKMAQEDRRNKKFAYDVKPLPPMDTNRYEMVLRQVATPLNLDLSTTNKLVNSVRWLKGPNGPIKMPVGGELEKLEITRITPLYLVVSLETINTSESGVRYVIDVEQQAAAKANQRGRRPYYVSVGDKKELFALREVKGPADNPTEFILELSDSGERISIARDKPFKRVDGYLADLRYSPENKSFLARRVGDKISIAGEEYNIVAISENEVVLSARSNGKKYTIRYNTAP